MLRRVFCIVLLAFIAFLNVYPCSYKERADKIIAELGNKYAVSFVYDSIPAATWKEVNYDTITEKDYRELLRFLNIFSEEFGKYPASFIEKTKIKYVAFVKRLNLSGQYRASLPDPYKEILYFDITKGRDKEIFLGNRSWGYLRHCIHHEIYHIIEQELNGSMYYKDSIWAGFNADSFHYGSGGASQYMDVTKKYNSLKLLFMKSAYKISYPNPGIITYYAGSALEEDKSEIYASLFVRREKKKVGKLLKKDEIIANKVNYMKNFLLSVSSDMTPLLKTRR